MLVPSSWKAATQANAMSAAATAYSESSKPLSSFKNFLNIRSILLQNPGRLAPSLQPGSTSLLLPGQQVPQELLDLAGEVVDLGANVGAQKLEGGDACQCDKRCGNCVFR